MREEQRQTTNTNDGIASLTDSSKHRVYSVAEMIEDRSLPPAALIEGGVLVHGGITLVHGKPKTGKTFLAMQMGIHLANGTPWFGFQIPKAVRVLVIQAELSYHSARDRIKLMAGGLGHSSMLQNMMISGPVAEDIADGKGYNCLKSMIKKCPAEVVIIDPLVYFHRKNENSNDEMGQVMARLRDLSREMNIGIILVHHDNKSPDSRGGDSSRGASAIFGAIDTDIQLSRGKRNKGDQHYQTLEFAMRHAKEPNPLKIYFQDRTLMFSDSHVSEETSKVMDILVTNPMIGKTDLLRHIKADLPCGKSKAYDLIKVLKEGGSIIENSEGVFSLPNSAFC